MDFRRSGQLDGRRRRVLRDEIAAADDEKDDASPVAAGSSSKAPVRAYGEAVLATRQPRVTDFIPLRPYHLSLLFLAGVTAIAAIVAAYTQAAASASGYISAPFGAFDLRAAGSIADWFSALLLAAGAAAAMVIFSIRVHRVDDYRGGYRVWLWTSAAFLFASADAAAGVHRALGAGLELLGGSSFEGMADICWLALFGLVFGSLAIRLGLEVWNALPAFSALCGSALLYLLTGLGAVGLIPAAESVPATVALATLTMLAHLTAVMSIVLFARHVRLDAQGRLLVSVQKERKKTRSRAKLSVVKDSSDDGRSRKASPAPERSSETATRPTAATTSSGKSDAPLKFNGSSAAATGKPLAGAKIQASSESYDDEDDDELEDGQNLSKAERKKLKRMNRREQRRAA